MAREKDPKRVASNYRHSYTTEKCSTCKNLNYVKNRISRYLCNEMDLPCESSGVCDYYKRSEKSKNGTNGSEKIIPASYKPCKCKLDYKDRHFRCKSGDHFYFKYYERGLRVLMFTDKFNTGLRFLTSFSKYKFKDYFEVIK